MSTTDLARALGDLQEDEVVAGVGERIAAGDDPTAILADVQRGMEIVGKRFEDGEYYLSELLYAADIFKQVNEPLAEKLASRETEKLATMVLGTVKNDIHEFGKDIVATILRSNGVEVVDLGMDVDYEAFVAAVREHHPQFVGMSCLLTTVFDDMKNTIAALEDAGLTPEDIGYINAHGTGTEMNDRAEALAIERLFGRKIPPVSSTKAFTGHTLGAAFAIEASISVLAIREQKVWPSIHINEVMPEISFLPPNDTLSVPVGHVMSNSFGFGGNNTSLIFSEI